MGSSNEVWLRRSRALPLVLLALSCVSAGAAADVPLPPPGSPPWQHVRFPSVDRSTEYERVPEQKALRAVSRCAASALVLPLAGIDLERTPLLRWRWRVVQSPAVGDERERSGDDFAARVYVTFPFASEGAGAFERLRRSVAERIFGRRLPGSALNYVWSLREPAGARWANPYAAESMMVSLGRGPLSEWKLAEVDLRRDYHASFGRAAPAPSAVAVMTDADDSCSRAEAWFADLLFAAEPVSTP